MEAEHIKVQQTVLKLSTEEALWLRAMVQNPIKEIEDPIDTEMRAKFWSALLGVVA